MKPWGAETPIYVYPPTGTIPLKVACRRHFQSCSQATFASYLAAGGLKTVALKWYIFF